jgi:hypothetical protein
MAQDLYSNLPPELFLQQKGLNRQQEMAKMLLAQGAQQNAGPAGQMVSGRYVPNSFFQNLQGPVNQLLGVYMAEKGDKQALELAQALRNRQTQEIEQFGELMKTDPAAAYRLAAQSYVPELRTTGVKKMMPEDVTLGEGQKRFMVMPDGTTRVVAQGEEKFKPPLQVDTGTTIEFRDPRDPTKVLQTISKTQMPTAGQVVERDDGTFLVNTRTGQATPVMGAGGQPLTGGGKPLTEAQGNAVAFGARAMESNRIATDLEKQGFRNTGAIRTAIGGVAGMTPFVGEQLEQGVRSTFNVAPTFLGGTNEQQQQVEQARRNFVSAVLRKESGAAIGVDEYKNEERKYFPQAGDSDVVIKQKQDARKMAIEALKAQAGPSGVRQINQIAGQSQSSGGGNVVDFNQLPTGRR